MPNNYGYTPSPKNQEWLNYCLDVVKSLPYKPTARYVFYRLHQDKGFPKSDYKSKFLPITSRARKAFWNGFTPETFADDTRQIAHKLDYGYSNPNDWFESFAERKPKFEVTDNQENIVIVCFEAKAMIGQFEHYLEALRIPLCAFSGDASIPYKYEIASAVMEWNDIWPDKPVHVLYFGDFDQKGLEIPENAMRDITKWCGVRIHYERCGLNEEHLTQYDIPASPNAPGKYQWEAVPDKVAKELIMTNVRKYWDIDLVSRSIYLEEKIGEIWGDAVGEAIETAKRVWKEREE